MRQTAILFSLLTTGAVLSGTAAYAADPALLNLVMPDAKVLAGVNVTGARISPFGQFIVSKIGLLGQDPEKFIAATGFNPLQDVSEILAASSADAANPAGLILASGTFPVDKFTAMLADNPDAQVQPYGGATMIVFSNPKEKTSHAVAFLGTTIAIAGDLASVKGAIDRQTKPTAIDAALAVRVKQLSGTEDEWVVSSASIAALMPANAVPAHGTADPIAQVLPLLKSIQSFDGGVKFGQNIAITGEAVTNSPQNAAALQAVIKLGITLVSSVKTDNNGQAQQFVQLLQSMQTKVNGSAVDIALSVPEAQAESLVNSVTAEVTAHAKPVVMHERSGDYHNSK